MRKYLYFLNTMWASQTSYRAGFFFGLLAKISTYVCVYFGIFIIFQRFSNLAGWTYYQCVFLYNINLLTYGVASMLVRRAMISLEGLVVSGDFDIILTKPQPTILSLILRNVDVSYLGHVVLAIAVFVYSIQGLQFVFGPVKSLLLLAFIISGVLFQVALILIPGSISLIARRTKSLVDVAIYGLRHFLDYPISIYPLPIQRLLVFAIPLAFINYYPSLYLVFERDLVNQYMLAGIVSVVVGPLMFILSIFVWGRVIRNYKSTGN